MTTVRSAFAVRRRSDAVLAVVDVLLVLVLARVAYSLRQDGALPHLAPYYEHGYVICTAVAAVTAPVAGRLAGLYRRQALRLGTSNLEAAFTTALVTGVVVEVVNAAALADRVARGWIALLTFGLLLSGVVSRGALARGRRLLVPLGIGLERYVVVGTGVEAQRLLGDLTRAGGAPFQVVATHDSAHDADEIVAIARRSRADGLILTAEAVPVRPGDLAERLAGIGVDVLLAPQIGQLDMRVASIAMLHGVPLLRVAGLAPRRAAVRVRQRDCGRRGVAILGTRGIPANYGGFETFAERLAGYLVEQGVDVTVYCRAHHATAGKEWHGVRLVTLPTIRSKYLDTVVHTALSVLHLVLTRGARDVVLCNAANAPVLPILRLAGRRVVLNVDGLEWRRSKWGLAGRAWYHLGEWLSVRLASVLVTDAHEVRTYYRVRHNSDSVMIPYGADLLDRGSVPVPPETPVVPGGFVLYVSRWEPENNPVMVATAHAASGIAQPLVMLGKSTYDDGLEAEVRAAAAPHAVLPGPVFGDGYRGLQANALCYVHATQVGGTHPALIEAMGAGNLVLVLDTPENREVVGDSGLFFQDADSLSSLLRRVAAMPAGELAAHRERARETARARFTWDVVGSDYLHLVRGGEPPRQPLVPLQPVSR